MNDRPSSEPGTSGPRRSPGWVVLLGLVVVVVTIAAVIVSGVR